jgi:cytochrome b6-f complex iron-sulfur subunit
MTDYRNPTLTGRRIFMTRSCGLFAACLTAPAWNMLAGCSPGTDDSSAGPQTVAVAELPLNRRVRLEQDGRAVEVVRTESGVTARSLLCTHQGCNVRWIEEKNIYLCPCHEGKFNAEGQPIYGPPRESLRWLTVTLAPTEAIIGG